MSVKKSLILALLCVSFAFFLPLIAVKESDAGKNGDPGPTPSAAPASPDRLPAAPSPEPLPAVPTPELLPAPAEDEALLSPPSAGTRRDEEVTLTVLTDEGILTLTMAEYLPGVLAGEMPLSFDPQALRAQAVAARTYALHEAAGCKPAHPESDVCASPGCCQVWKSEAQLRSRWGESCADSLALLCAAAEDTDGVILLWENEPALTCFHASSGGMTEDSGAVWTSSLPYLVPVESPETPETVGDLLSEVTVSPEEFSGILRSARPEIDLPGPPERWVEGLARDDSDRVSEARIGGADFTGVELRSLFSLRSAAFTLSWTGTEFLFSVIGSGHGIGMSQHGADIMARQGSSWQEILAHYYPGTTLGRM